MCTHVYFVLSGQKPKSDCTIKIDCLLTEIYKFVIFTRNVLKR